jgi:probable F420-dependent oxidoreductase
MERYLDDMEAAPYGAFEPTEPAPLVLAALGPRMLELAGRRTRGAHTYFVPVEHTAAAREILGTTSLLAVEQAVVFESEPTIARELARHHTSRYLALDNYRNNLVRLGWDETELTNGGSDRLVDALVAWGSPTTISKRIRTQHEAGADHVCIQIVAEDRSALSLDVLRHLAPVLRSF